jgi:hypothetical protein
VGYSPYADTSACLYDSGGPHLRPSSNYSASGSEYGTVVRYRNDEKTTAHRQSPVYRHAPKGGVGRVALFGKYLGHVGVVVNFAAALAHLKPRVVNDAEGVNDDRHRCPTVSEDITPERSDAMAP